MKRRDLPLGLVPVLTLVASGLGFSSGLPFLFPAFTMAAGYPLLVALLLSGRRRRALAAMLLWSGTAAAAAVGLCVLFPERAAEVVWNGPAYATEMFDWIATGEGPESDPRRFLPQHLIHTTAFVVLSLATASAASIFFGTVLLHQMAYYVAQVVGAADGAPMALAIGWHPWSILRVGSFVALGVILAEPLLGRLTGRGRRMEGGAKWLAAAAAGLAADAALKAWLAPGWRLWLLRSQPGLERERRRMVTVIEGDGEGSGITVGVILPRFNEILGSRLLSGALEALQERGVAERDIVVVRVPGSFEIPLAARVLLETRRPEVVIALGVLLRGATRHFDLVAGEVTRAISALALECGRPIVHGILAAESPEQAMERSGGRLGNRGRDAALAAIEMARLVRALRTPAGGGSAGA